MIEWLDLLIGSLNRVHGVDEWNGQIDLDLICKVRRMK